jgi:SHS2 domain-containing protein
MGRVDASPTTSGSARYRILAHTADTGIEAEADSLASLIEVVAVGMFELMAESDETNALYWVEFEISSATVADLLVDVLSELLFRHETQDLVFLETQIEAEPDPPVAKVRAGGMPLATVEQVGPPIKAVTYHDLLVEKRDQGWFARVYFDV